jgi:prevent-host-death family protein
MQTVTLDDAQQHLTELVRDLVKEQEIIITAGDKPVARLVSAASPRPSLSDIRPVSVGGVLRPYPSVDDDLLEEMLGAK